MKKRMLFLGIMMLVLVSCNNTISVTFNKDEFDTQKAAWQASNVTKYSYVYYSVSDAYPSLYLNVDVSGDEISVKEQGSNKQYTLSPEEYTIDSLFDDIWGLYHEYDGKKTPACDIYEYYDNIEVTYDKSNHIPTKIYAKAQVGNTNFFNNGVDGFSDYHVEVQNFQVK